MTPQILITQNGGVELTVSYDPIQSSSGSINGNVGTTDNRLVRTDGASGTVIQGSSVSLDDSGNMGLLGNLSVGGDLSVSGDFTASSASASLASLQTTGNADIGGDLTVTGDLTANNASLAVASLQTTGNAGVGGDLTVTGDLTANNASLAVASIQTTGNVGVGGDFTVTGDLTATNASLQVASVQSAGVVTASGFALSPGSPPYVSLTSNANGDANEVSCYVKADGTTFTAGQAVYISSVNGQNKIVSKAQANNELSSSRTLGLLKQNLAANAFGYVVTQGLLTGLDITVASTVSEGDPVWLSPTVAGGLVFGEANKPSSPNHLVYLGIVVKKNGSTKVNQIEVKVQNSNELAELSDVKLTSPATNDFLLYNSSQNYWENKTPSEVQAIISSTIAPRVSYVTKPAAYSASNLTVIPTGATNPWKDIPQLLAASSSDYLGYAFPITDANYQVSSYQITLHVVVNKTTSAFTGTMTYFCYWVKSFADFTVNVGVDPLVQVIDPSGLSTGTVLKQITFPAFTVPSGQAVRVPKFVINRAASPTITPSTIQFGVIGATLTYS